MSRIMATFYNLLMLPSERRCLRDWRTDLLSDLSGEVLEIGAGTGLSLACYPERVSHLTLVEPDFHMRRQLHKAAARSTIPLAILDASGENLDLAPGHFDAVVICLMLCSASDPSLVLHRVHHLLRPSGRLYFLEHVAAPGDSGRLRWQRWLEPCWKKVAGNCHLTRNTEQLILDSGFAIEAITRQELCLAPFFIGPTIRGVARKYS